MQIDSLNDLKKLIKVCKTLGVFKIEIDGIKLELSEIASVYGNKKKLPAEISNYEFSGIGSDAQVPVPDIIDMPDELTEEQKLFYSSQSVEPIV